MGKLEKMPKENILLDPILAALAQIWVVRIFFFCFLGFYLYLILETVASYHCLLFQGKQMNQT